MNLKNHYDTVKILIIDTMLNFDGHRHGDVTRKQTLMQDGSTTDSSETLWNLIK